VDDEVLLCNLQEKEGRRLLGFSLLSVGEKGRRRPFYP
jgi:hypothetical protein